MTSPDLLISAFKNGLTEAWQPAEEFSLPQDFIRRAYNYYFNEG